MIKRRPDKVKNDGGILHALHFGIFALPALSRRAFVFLRSSRSEVNKETNKRDKQTLMCER
jgi:hypothetical protein